MNFKEQMVDSGRIVGEMVAMNVGNNPEYFAQILDMVLHESMPMQSRAGRVFCLVSIKYPYLVKPHIDRILEHAQKGNVLHRSILQVFTEVKLDMNEDQEGILLDLCFDWLANKPLEVAHIIYCFNILFNFVKQVPELGPELADAIRSIIPHSSVDVKNRGQKILTAMQKMGAI